MTGRISTSSSSSSRASPGTSVSPRITSTDSRLKLEAVEQGDDADRAGDLDLAPGVAQQDLHPAILPGGPTAAVAANRSERRDVVRDDDPVPRLQLLAEDELGLAAGQPLAASCSPRCPRRPRPSRGCRRRRPCGCRCAAGSGRSAPPPARSTVLDLLAIRACGPRRRWSSSCRAACRARTTPSTTTTATTAADGDGDALGRLGGLVDVALELAELGLEVARGDLVGGRWCRAGAHALGALPDQLEGQDRGAAAHDERGDVGHPRPVPVEQVAGLGLQDPQHAEGEQGAGRCPSRATPPAPKPTKRPRLLRGSTVSCLA